MALLRYGLGMMIEHTNTKRRGRVVDSWLCSDKTYEYKVVVDGEIAQWSSNHVRLVTKEDK